MVSTTAKAAQMDETTKRQSVIDACLEMNANGINQGTSGNISLRHENGLLVTPTSIPYGDLETKDIVFLKMDGTAEGPRPPSSEWRFHRDIMAARPDVEAIVHAHPPYATTLAIMGKPIPAIHYMVAVAGGNDIPCAPYATFGTQELSEHAVMALRHRQACLLAHHGMIAVGKTLSRAMWMAVEVETLARQYLGCLQIGEPPILPDAEIQNVIDRIAGYGHQEKSVAA